MHMATRKVRETSRSANWRTWLDTGGPGQVERAGRVAEVLLGSLGFNWFGN